MAKTCRRCSDCKKLQVTQQEDDWSDVTPGNDLEMYCYHRHWTLDSRRVTVADVRLYFRTATRCDDWEENDG